MVLGNEDWFMVATTVVQGVLLWDSGSSQGFGSTGQETVTVCIGVGLLLFQEGVNVTW